jgi:hypothetical protein
MTRFTLHIPEQCNGGELISPEALATLEDRIIARAGGFTMTRATGAWCDEDTRVVYRESIRLYAIDGDESLRQPIQDLADAIALAFHQVATYVTEQAISTTLIYPGRIAA